MLLRKLHPESLQVLQTIYVALEKSEYDFLSSININAVAARDRKQLIARYGKRWQQHLGLTPSDANPVVDGGDFVNVFAAEKKAAAPQVQQRWQVQRAHALDNILEARQRISAWTGIPWWKLHVFDATARGYYLQHAAIVKPDIRAAYAADSARAFGCPVDFEIYENRDALEIMASDEYERAWTHEFNFIDFNTLVDYAEINLPQIEMFYWYFVVKFFPAISLNLLRAEIAGENISAIYPQLNRLPDFVQQDAILDELHENWQRAVRLEITDVVITSTVQCTLRSSAVFAFLQLDEIIPICALRTESRVFTRTHDTAEAAFLNVRATLNKSQAELCVVVRAAQHGWCVLELHAHHINLIMHVRPMTSIAEIWRVAECANAGIKRINALQRRAFASIYRLPTINAGMEIYNMNSMLYVSIALSQAQYKQLADFSHDAQAGLLVQNDTQPIQLEILKGCLHGESHDYAFWTSAQASPVQGVNIIIDQRATHLRCQISGSSQHQRFARNYILARIWQRTRKLNATTSTAERISSNKNQILKEFDPELYVFDDNELGRVYSRTCQRPNQPEIYSEEEYQQLNDKLKHRAVQYKNFTTGMPVYYLCPRKDISHLNFLTGKHPRNYCIPCCKKFSNERSARKREIYKHCLKYGTYNKSGDEFASSYAMRYGSELQPGRFGELPEEFARYIKYNTPENKNQQILIPELDIKVALEAIIDKLQPRFKHDFTTEMVNSIQTNTSVRARDAPIIVFRGKTNWLLAGAQTLQELVAAGKPVQGWLVNANLLSSAADAKPVEKSNYLLGVKQHYKISNCGMLFAIAKCMQIKPQEFLDWSAAALREQPEIFTLLLRGSLMQHYAGVREFAAALQRGEISNANTVFTDIAYFVFNYLVVEFAEDAGRIKLQSNAAPSTILEHTGDFILVVSQSTNMQNLASENRLYYPIVNLRPREFATTKYVRQRTWSSRSYLLHTVREFLDVNTQNFNLGAVRAFCESSAYKISHTLSTNSKLVHAVHVQKQNATGFDIPVEYSSISEIANKTRSARPAEFKQILNFIVEYNAWMIKYSEKLGLYRVGVSTQYTGLPGDNVEPVFTLVYPQYYIAARGAQRPDFLAFSACGLHWYFKPCAARHVDRALRKHQLVNTDLSVQYLYYDAEQINANMRKPADIAQLDATALQRAHEHVYAHEHWLAKFLHSIDRERNTALRKRISDNIKSIKTLDIDCNADDRARLLAISETAQHSVSAAHVQLQQQIFDFDKITLNKIQVLIHDYENTSLSQQALVRSKLERLLLRHVSRSEFLELLIADFTNPLKRAAMLRGLHDSSLQISFAEPQKNTSIFVRQI